MYLKRFILGSIENPLGFNEVKYTVALLPSNKSKESEIPAPVMISYFLSVIPSTAFLKIELILSSFSFITPNKSEPDISWPFCIIVCADK